jgi:hypothetical protein
MVLLPPKKINGGSGYLLLMIGFIRCGYSSYLV